MSTSTKTQQPEAAIEQVFDLDVTQVEIADPAGLVNVTDDGCGSTCGACNSTVA
ncbi:FxLD family lanthipeptide [Streptacidiphilus neutrinimicus]|uniref:FxLD family lanthipeptide n=1 Tax=Streptacidiphilus neutrinimicus TaxID=105420 RepID=UPI000A01243D|nr:FxLD family lanthipeptide [Streptacidiphilus neutrinimicus]